MNYKKEKNIDNDKKIKCLNKEKQNLLKKILFKL